MPSPPRMEGPVFPRRLHRTARGRGAGPRQEVSDWPSGFGELPVRRAPRLAAEQAGAVRQRGAPHLPGPPPRPVERPSPRSGGLGGRAERHFRLHAAWVPYSNMAALRRCRRKLCVFRSVVGPEVGVGERKAEGTMRGFAIRAQGSLERPFLRWGAGSCAERGVAAPAWPRRRIGRACPTGLRGELVCHRASPEGECGGLGLNAERVPWREAEAGG